MTIENTPVISIQDVCASNLDNIPQIPVYQPTEEEFNDFAKFIDLIEKRGAHHMGVCKIIPPKNWRARKNGYPKDVFNNLTVCHPIMQSTTGNDGIFVQDIKSEKSMTFKEYKNYSSTKNATPVHTEASELEQIYWNNLTTSKPLYGANVPGTLTDKNQKIWNVAHLPTMLDEILREQNLVLDGINTPYLYYGSWGTTFGWHVEDVDLYSINYLHYGAPKFWYVIPPAYARKFEMLTRDLYKSDFLKCDSFLRHKTVVISPVFLKRYGIPTRKIFQHENEFMFTFPYGYHAGFNTGLNIAESTNFASYRWIEFGKQAKLCLCWPDTVKINMEPFVLRYQRQLYNNWIKGVDNVTHPLKEYELKILEIKSGNPTVSACNNNNALVLKKRGNESVCCKTKKKSKLIGDCNNVTGDKNKHVFFDIFDTANMKNGSRLQRAHPMKSNDIKSKTGKLKTEENLSKDERLLAAKPIYCYVKSDTETNGIGKYTPRLLRSNFEALWRGNRYNFETEKEFNELFGNFYPHCAVCSIIWPISKVSEIIQKASSSSSQYNKNNIPKSTEPHISQLAFSKDRQFVICNQLKSRILRCTFCSLTVHARCYGKTEFDRTKRRQKTNSMGHSESGQPISKDKEDEKWMCDRCIKFNDNIYCCLCPIRGGALKKMSNSNGQNKWAHIICTLLTQNMEFDDIVRRRPKYPSISKTPMESEQCLNFTNNNLTASNNSNINSGHNTRNSTSNHDTINGYQKCYICRGKQSITPLCKCTYKDCNSLVHVSCGFFHSLLIESDTYPNLLYLICDKHPHYYTKQQVSNSHSIVGVGDYVYAQIPTDGYFYLATVQEKVSEALCKLIFPTGEYSDDTEVKYVKSHNIAKEGAPSIGTIVTVLWTDNELCDVKFQGLLPEVWKVKFKHSGQTLKLSRDYFYKTTELIPPHVERFLVDYKEASHFQKQTQSITQSNNSTDKLISVKKS